MHRNDHRSWPKDEVSTDIGASQQWRQSREEDGSAYLHLDTTSASTNDCIGNVLRSGRKHDDRWCIGQAQVIWLG